MTRFRERRAASITGLNLSKLMACQPKAIHTNYIAVPLSNSFKPLLECFWRWLWERFRLSYLNKGHGPLCFRDFSTYFQRLPVMVLVAVVHIDGKQVALLQECIKDCGILSVPSLLSLLSLFWIMAADKSLPADV